METLSRESSLLDYMNFTDKELDRQYNSILNPWMDLTFINRTDSGLEIIIKIALAIITFTGSLWISFIHDNFFHTISESDSQDLDSISSEIALRKEQQQKWKNTELDPQLVKKEFSQIDREALIRKLTPVLGSRVAASRLSGFIMDSGSYKAAIDMLLLTQNDLSDDGFFKVIEVIKGELYSK